MKIIENHWRKEIYHDSAESAVRSAVAHAEHNSERIEILLGIVGRLIDTLPQASAGECRANIERILGPGFEVEL